MLIHQLPHLKQRYAHFDTQRFDFIAAGNDAAIVVTEYGHRFADQIGPKHPFTADVKIVAIDQADQLGWWGNELRHTA